MRLIDADVLKEKTTEVMKLLQKGLGKDADFAYRTSESFLKDIDEQPTAYDLENVVEQLESLKENYRKARENTYCRSTETDDCDSCRADHYLDARLSTIDRVIEIVKGGGVNGN